MKKYKYITTLLALLFITENFTAKENLVNNCATDSRIIALEIVDYFGLDLDNVDDLSTALTIYNELYSDCYNERNK